MQLVVVGNNLSIGRVCWHGDDMNKMETGNGCDENTVFLGYSGLRVGMKCIAHVKC